MMMRMAVKMPAIPFAMISSAIMMFDVFIVKNLLVYIMYSEDIALNVQFVTVLLCLMCL